MLTKKTPNDTKFFVCEKCTFKCSKQSEWNRHISTLKHVNIYKCLQNPEIINKKIYKCICGKEYGYRQSLHIHRKKCLQNKGNENEESNTEIISSDFKILTNLVLEVVKNNSELQRQNQEFQKQMLELYKNNSSTINNTHNSHNKTFNMQFFLNEQCKDAMNLMDFVDTFKLQFSDLERVGEVGYVEGISDIIIKKLNEMDIYKRPIHCSDAKRETLYVKDKNVWEKENGNHDKLRLAIKHITKKNTDMLNPWCNKHPGSCDSDNYLNDIYLEMVMQAMGGRGGIEENENKIIRKIAKTVLIDK
jgi:hypothetical protein